MKILVEDLYKSFDKNQVLKGISFNLSENLITALVGRNGSGKTTLLKIMCGIFDQDKGSISLDGKSLKEDPKLIENIAYLPDRFDYFNYSKVSDLIGYYKIIYPDFDKDFYLDQINKNGLDPKENIRNLSKGYKKLLGLITVLSTRANILLLDEILDGMDVLNKEIVANYLLDAKEEGRTILASSHELEQLSGISDEVLYLSKDGHIENVSRQDDHKFNKVQIVVKKELPQEILNNSVLRFNLGRVYTLLIGLDEEKIKNLLDREEIVQYDILPIQVEDNFYWERGRKNG
jgi:ABC-2 type transport system ATP-binding protein